MEPDAKVPENPIPQSCSDDSQELCMSESYNEDDFSDPEYPLETQSTHHIQQSDFTTEDWESTVEQQSVSEVRRSREDVLCDEDEENYLSESRESKSPHSQTSHTSSLPEHPNTESYTDPVERVHCQSSSPSVDCAADMTLALTLTPEQPLGTSDSQDPGTGNSSVESSEEGGSTEAPPASVFFGISNEVAEQAEKRNSNSDIDLCRRERHRARCTRLSYKESQSERHIKETKFKCKRIARLLTDAPNPQNKGALLFKKRRQRVKKYTLVSYGTGDNKTDTEDQTEEEAEEVRTAGNNFVTTSDSELEEENSVFNQQLNLSLNWRRVREMEALPETKGKGALMFTQRRKRMDEILTEQEELKGKGLPTEGFIQPTEGHHVHDMKEMYLHTDQVDHIDANTQQMNTLFNVPKALVPNRTAKPFLGFQFHGTAPVMTVGFVPAKKKADPRFKVPVPINTSPQVWSPTGDIIASRDERISVPAIKTAILPESKRKGTKQQASLKQETHQSLHNKGERRSYIEPEEDCFSLGAEACNFMQPKATKLKNPPPVAPKPAINAQYPLLMRSPSGEPYIQPRSPGLQRSHCPMEPQSQHYFQQQDWAQPQETTKLWVPDQAQTTRQTHDNSSSKLVQTNTNSWSQRLPRSPVSMQTGSPTYSPHHPPSPTRNLSNSAQNSVASCPPQAGKSYGKALQSTSKKPFADKVGSQAGEGRTMSGKGAELFAKRQSRVEKFVVDIEKVNMKKTRSPSPTASLPNSWRYSPNIRAPPPMSYNPLLSPFYPPSAAKQAPSSSSKINSKTKEKPKSAPKHLSALDIMKHQPYQLNSSLFKYDVVSEGKGPTPKPAPPSKFEATKSLKHRFNLCHLSCNVSEPDSDCKSEASAKSSGLVSIHDSCGQQSQTGKPAIHKHLDEKHAGAPAVHHVSTKPASSIQAAGRFAQQSSADDSIASAFSPASLIARGACQMAPRPKFSAKKPVVMTKQWRPVAIMN